MTYNIFTIGCQQNAHDSIRLKFILNKLGFCESTETNADIIFIVACSVRQKAVDRIFGKLKKWGTNKKVLITACVLPSDKKKFQAKGAIFFDISNLNLIKRHLDINPSVDLQSLSSQSKDSAFIPIMTGCDNFCSYCAVPYTRGREKSRPVKETVTDFKKLVASGRKAITLLGQNVNSYKINQKSKVKSQNDKSKVKSDFAMLLETLNNIPGIFTIKFLTNHPKDMSDDVINAIAILPKVDKEIHLPLQSGSTRILKLMNRKYTKENYLDLVAKIRKTIPKARINTDIIVGFPGETKEDFEDTLEVVEKTGFYTAYVAMYSPRPGTAAAEMIDNVPLETKKSRFRVLNELINKK